MAKHALWEDLRRQPRAADPEVRAGAVRDQALGDLVREMRTEAGLSVRALAVRMGTTPSVVARLEAGGGACDGVATLAKVATALDRHLVVSFPSDPPDTGISDVRLA